MRYLRGTNFSFNFNFILSIFEVLNEVEESSCTLLQLKNFKLNSYIEFYIFTKEIKLRPSAALLIEKDSEMKIIEDIEMEFFCHFSFR